MYEAINTLTDDQKQIILLKFVEGFNNKEISDITGKQEDSIRALQYRALVKLREILEESQRTKADFLNAKRRLEEERKRDRERGTISHIEDLIPLCDSFQVAMSNKEVWEKADENWRKGIEGIYSQLQNILSSNQVSVINPIHTTFNPHQHEALSTIPVTDEKEDHMVMAVIQMGYELKKTDNTTEIIRPARVIIGTFEK